MSDDHDWEELAWEDFVSANGALYLEERNERRFRLYLNLTLSTATLDYSAFSGNVSDSGLFVATPETLPLGTELNLGFTLPGREDRLELRAQVCWSREEFDLTHDVVPGFGVRFLDLVCEDRFKLFRFLDNIEMHEKLSQPPD